MSRNVCVRHTLWATLAVCNVPNGTNWYSSAHLAAQCLQGPIAPQYGMSCQHDILCLPFIAATSLHTPQLGCSSDVCVVACLFCLCRFWLSEVRIKYSSRPNSVCAAHFVLFNSLRSSHKTQSLSSSVSLISISLFGRKLTLCLFMAKCFTFRWGSLYRIPS